MMKVYENNPQFKQSIWIQAQQGDWKLLFNINENQNIQKTENENQLKVLLENAAFKCLKMGTLVMTPRGIGRLIKLEEKLATVKLTKDDSEETFEENLVSSDFPIFLRILDKDFSNWFRIHVPANGNVEGLKKIIEDLKIIDLSNCNYLLIYNGSEIKEENTFDQLELRANSKFLLCGQKVVQCKLARFTLTYNWWYTYNCDGVTFSVTKRIKLAGVGLYGSHEGKTQTGTIKIFEGTVSSMGSFLIEEQVDIPPAPDQSSAVVPIRLKKPIAIKPNLDYTIQFVCTTYCYLYYGNGGKPTMEGEKGIEFSFKYTPGSSHGTGAESGNFPEFYYYA